MGEDPKGYFQQPASPWAGCGRRECAPTQRYTRLTEPACATTSTKVTWATQYRPCVSQHDERYVGRRWINLGTAGESHPASSRPSPVSVWQRPLSLIDPACRGETEPTRPARGAAREVGVPGNIDAHRGNPQTGAMMVVGECSESPGRALPSSYVPMRQFPLMRATRDPAIPHADKLTWRQDGLQSKATCMVCCGLNTRGGGKRHPACQKA